MEMCVEVQLLSATGTELVQRQQNGKDILKGSLSQRQDSAKTALHGRW